METTFPEFTQKSSESYSVGIPLKKGRIRRQSGLTFGRRLPEDSGGSTVWCEFWASSAPMSGSLNRVTTDLISKSIPLSIVFNMIMRNGTCPLMFIGTVYPPHHITPLTWISLTLSRHQPLSSIAIRLRNYTQYRHRAVPYRF